MSKRPRGIYILPNLFTTFAMFCGFYALLLAGSGEFVFASSLIFVAMVFDGLDGRVARLTNTSSEFGVQYDSLSDLISFGVAPALLLYNWSLRYLEYYSWLPQKLAWMGAFIFVTCAALRLARFNVQTAKVDKAFFRGLPSPAAAALIATLVWVGNSFEFSPQVLSVYLLLVIVIVALLMVSNFNYFSFKSIKSDNRFTLMKAVIFSVILGLVFLEPSLFFLLIFLGYAIHGPLLAAIRYLKKHKKIKS